MGNEQTEQSYIVITAPTIETDDDISILPIRLGYI